MALIFPEAEREPFSIVDAYYEWFQEHHDYNDEQVAYSTQADDIDYFLNMCRAELDDHFGIERNKEGK